MAHGMEQQKAAVDSGHWPLFRYNPALVGAGQEPVPARLARAEMPLEEYIYNETRYTMLAKSNPEEAEQLLDLAQEDVSEPLEALRAHGRAGNGAPRR